MPGRTETNKKCTLNAGVSLQQANKACQTVWASYQVHKRFMCVEGKDNQIFIFIKQFRRENKRYFGDLLDIDCDKEVHIEKTLMFLALTDT